MCDYFIDDLCVGQLCGVIGWLVGQFIQQCIVVIVLIDVKMLCFVWCDVVIVELDEGWGFGIFGGFVKDEVYVVIVFGIGQDFVVIGVIGVGGCVVVFVEGYLIVVDGNVVDIGFIVCVVIGVVILCGFVVGFCFVGYYWI